MSAGLYLRMSDDRTGQGAGIERQAAECTELAASLGVPIVDRYIDNDVSASSTKPRPEYRRMLDDIAAGRITTVIAWHADRLYRRPADLEELIPLCERHGVTIRTVRAGDLDLSTPTGRMVARLLGAVARHEVEHKADRHRLSVATNRAKGKWTNSRDRLYGYQRDGVVHPEEAERLRWIAEQVRTGRSLVRIATDLNDDGATTTRGNRWSPGAIRHLLLNPRIAGLATLRGAVVGVGEWEPILDRATWEATTACLAPYRPRPPRAALLTRLVWCHCGTMMHSGRRGRARIYRCPCVPPYNTGCGVTSIQAEHLEELAEAYARAKLDDPRFRRAVAARMAGADETARRAAAEVDELERRADELGRELGDARGRAAAAVVAAIADVEARLSAARARLGTRRVELPAIGADWPADVERRSALIGLTLSRLVIDPSPGTGRRFVPERVRIEPVEDGAEVDGE